MVALANTFEWWSVCRRTHMSDPDHIKAFRLFELVQRDNTGAGLQLAEWEREHLQSCEECRELEEFLRRQFSEGPHLHNNGDVSPADGWYRNLCCDLDVYVLVGKRFPDCRRHKNLPTSWKRIEDPPRKQSA